VRVFGDAAVVTGRITIKGTYKGQSIDGSYRYTDVFARKGGQWLCVASQSTMLTPATK
jgi:ketosteroid isomerase-like protein